MLAKVLLHQILKQPTIMITTHSRSKRLIHRARFATLTVATLFLTACSANGSSPAVSNVGNNYVVNINARTSTPDNPVTITLHEGTYRVSVIGTSDGGAYNAWKPWFYEARKDENGQWIRGWIHKYSFSSEEFGEVTCTDNTIYETPLRALSHGIPSTFTLKKTARVNFYVLDSPHIDNSGGVSLLVVPDSTK
jgi:hypothetical protein